MNTLHDNSYDDGALRAKVCDLVASGAFVKRRWSWVGSDDQHFFKIPRLGDMIHGDLGSKETLSLAEKEQRDLLFLADLSDAITKPIACVDDYSCLVFRFVNGQDLRNRLLLDSASDVSLEYLHSALAIIARLHERSLGLTFPDVPLKNYMRGSPSARSTLVVKGFEVRNIRIDSATGKLWLFDPSSVAVGQPEDDFTRFVLSLLMLRWGRHADCRLWTNFSLRSLVSEYERRSGIKLSTDKLISCFRRNLAATIDDARREISMMPTWIRPFAAIYMKAFFQRIRYWTVRHDF